VRGSLLGRDTNPWQPDNEENLCEGEIEETQVFVQVSAVLGDRGFGGGAQHGAQVYKLWLSSGVENGRLGRFGVLDMRCGSVAVVDRAWPRNRANHTRRHLITEARARETNPEACRGE
jgi:hypothetical protein